MKVRRNSKFLASLGEISISLVGLGNFGAGWFLPGFDVIARFDVIAAENGHVVLEKVVFRFFILETFLRVSPRLLGGCGNGLADLVTILEPIPSLCIIVELTVTRSSIGGAQFRIVN